MEKLKQWLFGLIAAGLIGSGGWAWGYAFSTESRVSKLEAHYEDIGGRLERIENSIVRIEEYNKMTRGRKNERSNGGT